jgi:peptidoglycan/xylan/chitin deacetylase (PgdA/CDA1 family)
MTRVRVVPAIALMAVCGLVDTAVALEPIPDKLVVLTFDDSAKSHYTVARPILRKHGFGGTFFITEGFDFTTNKRDYMTWDEIAELHRDGFEIGNHSKTHPGFSLEKLGDLAAEVRWIEQRCREHGIPAPISFAYPGNMFEKGSLPILSDAGILWARRGGEPEFNYKSGEGAAYQPGIDHPLLIPSAGDSRPEWTLDDFKRAVQKAKHGRIAVLQFHGVPDTAHAWVNTPQERFEEFMQYLADEKYTVIAMRDLSRYVDPRVQPSDPWFVIQDRQSQLKAGGLIPEGRKPADEASLTSWLMNMRRHEFTPAEMATALDLSPEELVAESRNVGFPLSAKSVHPQSDVVQVLPYPGGRHPRTGFRDGALRPRRETKVSVFAPWAGGGYAVVDAPEAVWHDTPTGPGLLFLAHTHIPTVWDADGVTLEPVEWAVNSDGSMRSERRFPNRVVTRTHVVPGKDGVRMRFEIHNGGGEPLTGLRVQMCAMLARLTGFDALTNENKLFEPPFSAAHDGTKSRWIIHAWEPCQRAWGNAPCPCLHSDPQVPDCPPGESRQVAGWVSFYEGTDIADELTRLKPIAFPAEK